MQPFIPESDPLTGDTLFKIVIVYENLATGIRGQEMAERLMDTLKADVEVNIELWKFDLLDYPSMREQAARDVAEADMLIISTEANVQLPLQVRNWIESVLPPKRRGQRALVALLGQPRQEITWETENVREYLRQLAEKHRMDFFCKTEDALTNLDEVVSAPQIPSSTLVFLEEAFTPDVGWRRWGIND